MDFITKNKGALGGGILLILALVAYNMLSSSTIPDPTSAPAASVGADLLKVADNISKATLSKDLFSASGYRILSDFSVPLESEPLGRANPFAPIGQ